MKVIKGNFSDHNKKKESSVQKKNQDIPVIQDEGGSYSIMLLDLIKPYLGENPTGDKLEEMVQIGMLAWNLSISKSLGIPEHNEIIKTAVAESGFDKKQVELLKRIETDKQEKHPDHTNFIASYEITKGNDNIITVRLTCIPLGDMLREVMDLDEDDFDDEEFDADDFPFDDTDDSQFEEGMVDRSAFSLKHQSAFTEWAKKINNILDPTGSVIYLIEEKGSEEEAINWLKKNFKKFMNDELAEVTDDKKKWPKLTYKVFCDFFEVQFHPMIWDTVEEPINK